MTYYPENNAGASQKVITGISNGKVLTDRAPRLAHHPCIPDALDDNIILESVTHTLGLVEPVLDGAGLDIPRTCSITASAGAVAAGAGTTIITLTGLDVAGNIITEALTAISGVTEGVVAFASVTSVSCATAELYTIALDTPASGTFLLGNDDNEGGVDGWTTAIAYDASDGDILAALKVVYGNDNVISVTSLEVEFLPGVLADLEFDGALLVSAPAAAMTTDTTYDLEVGNSDLIGIPALLAHPTVFNVLHDEVQIVETAWTNVASSTAPSGNTLDPGGTVGAALDGTKVLDIYYCTT